MGNVLVQEETLKGIADAIREKNGTSGLYKPGEMPEAILEIETYSGDAADPDKPIRFYGAYGELIYSYSFRELEEMTELPVLPEYRGLTGQGWNWSLENIKDRGNETEIGSLYITDDGATRIYIELMEEALNPKVGFYQMTPKGVWIDWGDGSELETSDVFGEDTMVSVGHHYEKAGAYVIRLIPEEGAEFYFYGEANSTRILHIKNDSFYGNRVYGNSIIKIELGKGITKFKGRCFNSGSLKSVTIPKEIASFDTAFCENPGIKFIVIPQGVTSLPSYGIRQCTAERILFPDNSVTIGGSAISGCTGLKQVCMPKTMDLSYSDIFSGCSQLKKVILADSLQKIPSDCFEGCSALNEIVLPAGITEIGSGAFKEAKSLLGIEIPDSVAAVKSSAFYNCFSLRKVKIPEGVTVIYSLSFAYCYSLHEAEIPKNVIEIQRSAFSNCIGIEDYYLYPEIPPVLVDVNAFEKISDTCRIHVPKGCLEAYQTAENWSTYADRMVEMEV